MRALLSRIIGRSELQIIDDCWHPLTAGQLKALCNGRMAAHLKTWTHSDAPNDGHAPVGLSGPLYVHFFDCWTAPKLRSRGIGTKLVSEALVRMKLDLQADTVVYGWVPSERPRSFWERFGFQIGHNPNSGEVVMHARLSSTTATIPDDRLDILLNQRIDHGIITSAYGPEEASDDIERSIGKQPTTE